MAGGLRLVEAALGADAPVGFEAVAPLSFRGPIDLWRLAEMTVEPTRASEAVRFPARFPAVGPQPALDDRATDHARRPCLTPPREQALPAGPALP